MAKLLSYKFLYLFILVCCFSANSQVLRKKTTLLMGGRFDISIVAKDSATASQKIEEVIAEITRIENLISDWKSDSQVSEVNQNSGIRPVKVDREVFELTQRAIQLSKITNGGFDVSFAAMDRIWKFDGSMTEMPSAEAIKKSVEKVGYQNIILDSVQSTIFLKLKGMKIGFGALGEGYAADKCRDMMIAKGIEAGIINGSGDMSTWGKQPNGSPWKIGITNPFNPEKLLAVVPLEQEAVTTSGSYEKFVVFDGKRYSHIINPATGYPATGLCSVTVFGPNAETANGLSTSLMVLGKTEGLLLLKKFPDYSCIMITDNGKVVKSDNFKIKKFKAKF
ncbi:FAD:protein FMN transferase [Flavobacterium reichenbachii]|uniref:FAD:protein FMN transferase n=1 Tax=Flavobacterium reichenbachii TaxID=362418 RepID=A0A085ZGK2_9FLAO|nr:FAD:protein FMN transferase [Flavobacterium reichenbachii]KFF03566.1 thiamine biosynthesis protein ApbE [Flavobacterium reichenbachii]OXB15620.1 thiamine biosynthesis protein ApbE [Flavobacterium reichenbachii]